LRSHPQHGVYTLRPASAGDQAAIRRLVYQARINPRGLDWRRFVLAVDAGQRMVGCGQIKPHGDGSRELASIAVDPGWREGGVASAMIGDLMQAGPSLWLVCRSQLTPASDSARSSRRSRRRPTSGGCFASAAG
jgi:ribosomal protein S18 acetylase RimI-like enzyme